MGFTYDIVINDPLTFLIFLKGDFMLMSLVLEVIIDFGFTEFG